MQGIRKLYQNERLWLHGLVVFFVLGLDSGANQSCQAQVGDVSKTTAVVDAIIQHFNQDNFASIFELGTEKSKSQSKPEFLEGFLSKQIKPLGKITSRELIEDLGEMKYYRLDFVDGERKQSLRLNLGVDNTGHYYALGFRNMPAKQEPRDPNVESDNPCVSEIDLAVDAAARKYMAKPTRVGVSIGVVYDGKLHAFHYGETVAGNRSLPTSDSFFEIGSITKTFTGILLAQAVLDQKLKLDDDIRVYLDEKYPNLEFEGTAIQVRHLSTHTSGLPSITDNVDSSDDATDPWGGFSKEKLLDGLHRVALQSKPGTTNSYSNIGVGLLGIVLERVCGASFAELVEQYISKPAGMRETKIELSDSEVQRYVTGHTDKGKVTPHWNVRGAEAAGALRSTTNDMMRYLKWNIDEQDPAVRMSHETHWAGIPNNSGLGWFQLETGTGYLHLAHDGGTGGFRTSCNVYPKLGLGIIVMANNGDAPAGDLANEIYFRITKSRFSNQQDGK
jgi:CubicO group peptidase (beta-lactamase class C family)